MRSCVILFEQGELLFIKGILAFQACVVGYYSLNIIVAFIRAVLGWNPKKGAIETFSLSFKLVAFVIGMCCFTVAHIFA